MKQSFQRFLRVLKPAFLSLWGGTLLSSGLFIFIGIVGLTTRPSLLWMLLLGACFIAIAGIMLFLAALRLETSRQVFDRLPPNVSQDDIDRRWWSSLDQHGAAIITRLVLGCTLTLAGDSRFFCGPFV